MTASGRGPIPRTGAVDARGRRSYAAVTFLLAAGGVAAAAGGGWGDPAAVAAGVFGAWAIQAVAFWRLARALAEERDATRVWVLGIGARIGGLALAFAASRATETGGTELLLAFGVAILAFLLLEAGWLARRRGGGSGGSAQTRVDPTHRVEARDPGES